jgi:putative zinc finger protein
MKTCLFENYFVEYVSGELDKNEKNDFQSHLDTCPTCPSRLDEFYELHGNLKSRKKKEPQLELLAKYHENLSSEFSESKTGVKLNQKIENIIESIFWQRSLNIRIAEVVGLILIGIFIGWFIFNPQSEIRIDSNINPNYFPRPISKAEVEYINYYFQAAELLLLEIKNIDLKTSLNRADIEFNKDIAQKLLIKTFIIHEIALRQNDPKILRFLSKMELLLYEVSNVPSEELSQSVNALNIIIDDSRLLDDARKFQKDLIRYQGSKNELDALKENKSEEK